MDFEVFEGKADLLVVTADGINDKLFLLCSPIIESDHAS